MKYRFFPLFSFSLESKSISDCMFSCDYALAMSRLVRSVTLYSHLLVDFHVNFVFLINSKVIWYYV